MKPYKTLKIVNKNKYAEMYYRRALSDETERLIKAIFKDIDKEYTTIYTSNAGSINKMQALFKKYKGKYLDIFLKNCEKIIKKWFKISSSQSIRSMKEVYKKALGRNVIIKYDKIYDDVLKLVIQRNVGLIQNTTLQTLNNIENIVYDGITTGQGLKTVEKDLNKQGIKKYLPRKGRYFKKFFIIFILMEYQVEPKVPQVFFHQEGIFLHRVDE